MAEALALAAHTANPQTAFLGSNIVATTTYSSSDGSYSSNFNYVGQDFWDTVVTKNDASYTTSSDQMGGTDVGVMANSCVTLRINVRQNSAYVYFTGSIKDGSSNATPLTNLLLAQFDLQ